MDIADTSTYSHNRTPPFDKNHKKHNSKRNIWYPIYNSIYFKYKSRLVKRAFPFFSFHSPHICLWFLTLLIPIIETPLAKTIFRLKKTSGCRKIYPNKFLHVCCKCQRKNKVPKRVISRRYQFWWYQMSQKWCHTHNNDTRIIPTHSSFTNNRFYLVAD